MYLDDALLYNQGYMISINDLDSPLFYLFDYDSRSFKINMSFQHFHQFHEIHILLSGRASHLIEGDYYTLQPMISYCCALPCCTRPSIRRAATAGG